MTETLFETLKKNPITQSWSTLLSFINIFQLYTTLPAIVRVECNHLRDYSGLMVDHLL